MGFDKLAINLLKISIARILHFMVDAIVCVFELMRTLKFCISVNGGVICM